MRKLVSLVLAVSLLTYSPAKASIFGEETAVLIEILANAVKQLTELKAILDNGKDTLNLIQDINRGINDSLNLARTVYPNIDSGIYKDWQNASDAILKLQTIYGAVANSPDLKVQTDTDQNVAEAVAMNNDIYKYRRSPKTHGSNPGCYASSPESNFKDTGDWTQASGSNNGCSKQKRQRLNQTIFGNSKHTSACDEKRENSIFAATFLGE
jgi:hypothetical protein